MSTREDVPGLDQADPDWEPAKPLPIREGMNQFVAGEPVGNRLRVRYFRRNGDGALVGNAWFGPGAEGPPGHAHGGSMAALLDEVMGGSAWLAGHPVLARKIEIEFLAMLPLGTVARFEGRIATIEGRKVNAVGTLCGPDGTVFAKGTGLFLKVDPGRLKARV